MKYPPAQMALVILVGLMFVAFAAATWAAEHPASVSVPSPSSLYKEISKADSALSKAFNAHDLNALMSLFTEDLEFYHDENGRRDCGTFKFLQVWRSDAGKWRITRVISYGH